jgi:hypothetical protein
VAGLFRAVASPIVKFPRWGWAVFSGVITAVLGFILLAQMPVSASGSSGCHCVDLIFDGIATIVCGRHTVFPTPPCCGLTSNFIKGDCNGKMLAVIFDSESKAYEGSRASLARRGRA